MKICSLRFLKKAARRVSSSTGKAIPLLSIVAFAVSFSAAQNSQPRSARRPIQTKTNAEYQAYQAAIANSQNPEAMEKAADDFSSKFPDSDVRVLLYRAARNGYQTAGNSQKTLDVGMKVLALDKDDPEALIGVAEVLEEQTSPTDLDKEKRLQRAIESAQHGLETIDTDLPVPAGTSAEKVEAYKKTLRSAALAVVGTAHYKQGHYPEAETNLRKAIEADQASPDPVVVLQLALALDQQAKYADALQQANRAVELTKENTDVGTLARNEKKRLEIETAASSAQNPAPPQNSTAPGH